MFSFRNLAPAARLSLHIRLGSRVHTSTIRAMSSNREIVTPDEVLEFWFGAGESKPNFPLWFQSNPQTDAFITEKFGPSVEAALAGVLFGGLLFLIGQGATGRLQEWDSELYPMLAKIILLDQFPRNMYRGSARAFSGDVEALKLAKVMAQDRPRLIDPLNSYQQAFVVLPFQHSEDLGDHDVGMALADYSIELATKKYAPEEEMGVLRAFKSYCIKHKVIIERFGRYPHRNAVLGRDTTPDEDEYLKTADRFGQ